MQVSGNLIIDEDLVVQLDQLDVDVLFGVAGALHRRRQGRLWRRTRRGLDRRERKLLLGRTLAQDLSGKKQKVLFFGLMLPTFSKPHFSFGIAIENSFKNFHEYRNLNPVELEEKQKRCLCALPPIR